MSDEETDEENDEPKAPLLSPSMKRLQKLIADLGAGLESGELMADLRVEILANPIRHDGRLLTPSDAFLLRHLAGSERAMPRFRLPARYVRLLPALERAGFVVERAGLVALTARGRSFAVGYERAYGNREKQLRKARAAIERLEARFSSYSSLLDPSGRSRS